MTNGFATMKTLLFLLLASLSCIGINADEERKLPGKLGKVLPIFQVVNFPNDPCFVDGGSKNGTCYTSEECENKGGSNSGSCAEGFGVCCTFTAGCGASTTENCTYFESPSSATTVNGGPCRLKACKCSSNICQMRLDFITFVISGPSTLTGSIGETLHGTFTTVAAAGAGADVTNAGQCITDTFTVGSTQVPTICGTNTGDHVYFEATQDCHNLDFQFGNVANGLSNIASRSWNIKVTQYSCDHPNLAPAGCTQYYYGTEATNQVRTFNWQGTRHLNSQRQIICVRREAGNCRICWSADTPSTDFEIGGKAAKFNALKGEICCAYEADGKGPTGDHGYDCVIIPGAQKTDGSIINSSQCGHGQGLATAHSAAANDAMTVCSKQVPFSISFISDEFEGYYAAADDGESEANAGFKLRYFQTTC